MCTVRTSKLDVLRKPNRTQKTVANMAQLTLEIVINQFACGLNCLLPRNTKKSSLKVTRNILSKVVVNKWYYVKNATLYSIINGTSGKLTAQYLSFEW